MSKAEIGLVGLGVMGRNLVLNMEEKGFPVAVWNRRGGVVDQFLDANRGKELIGTRSLEELAEVLSPPRRIMLMVKAGEPVDDVIGRLRPHLAPGDIVIDGGNSWFEETRRREAALKKEGIHYFGVGVSGGEEGARHGPSIMPGGERSAYEHLRPVLEAIAARSDSGPCVTYVGPDGAGHFVKMVHNGIEYGDMQLIAEAYDLLRRTLGLEADELAEVFAGWNRGPLESFLMELTASVLVVRDEETGKPLVDLVLDKAGQKGTGRWTVQVALDLGVPIPTIAAALDGRVLSSMKEERVRAEQVIKSNSPSRFGGRRELFIEAVRDALYASKICSYAQGMSLIRVASQTYHWDIDLSEVARIWKAGCIIRARLLEPIREAYRRQRTLPNLLLDEALVPAMERAEEGWRFAVRAALRTGIPVPALASSLNYFDSYRTARLPQNLTQAQRDAFGAHTYERIDHPERGFVHTGWLKRGGE